MYDFSKIVQNIILSCNRFSKMAKEVTTSNFFFVGEIEYLGKKFNSFGGTFM
jgi:hypothetical protein